MVRDEPADAAPRGRTPHPTPTPTPMREREATRRPTRTHRASRARPADGRVAETDGQTERSDGKSGAFAGEAQAVIYRPQYERITELIVEYIRQHQLHAGDRLPTEQEFAEQFGVSRAIVRDAIKMLTPSGVVRTRRGSGIFVGEQMSLSSSAPLSLAPIVPPEHIRELFDFRRIQEMQTARLAAQHISVAELRIIEQSLVTNRQAAASEEWETFLRSDDEFHHGIAMAAHNVFLAEAVASVLRLQRWAIKVLTGGAPGSMQAAVQQHASLFDAIRDGSPDRAAEAARLHVESVFANYQQAARRRLIGEHELG